MTALCKPIFKARLLHSWGGRGRSERYGHGHGTFSLRDLCTNLKHPPQSDTKTHGLVSRLCDALFWPRVPKYLFCFFYFLPAQDRYCCGSPILAKAKWLSAVKRVSLLPSSYGRLSERWSRAAESLGLVASRAHQVIVIPLL